MADYKAVVKRAVRKAFAKVGTLATTVRFIAGQPTGFDFNTAGVIESSSTALVLKGIITETKKPRGEKDSANCIAKTILLIADDVPNLGSYDRVLIDNVPWKVVHPVKNDGFVVTVDITKEI